MLCTYQGAGRTRPRSALTGSMLPTTLREMSPCDVAESVIGRPQNTSSWTGSEAECRDAVCVGSANLVLSGGKTFSFLNVTRCAADTRSNLYAIVVLSGGTNISFQSVMKRGAVHLVIAALSEACDSKCSM